MRGVVVVGGRRVCVLLCVVVLWVLGVGVGVAFAELPWWHLTSGARPTFVHAGGAVDEKQEIVVRATGGDVLMKFYNVEGLPRNAAFAYDASAGEVQVAVDEMAGGAVSEVTGPAGGPYVVTFTGGMADEEVNKGALVIEPLEAKTACMAENPETGVPFGPCLEGEASAVQLVAGQPDAVVASTAVNVGDANAEGEVRLTDRLPAGFTAAWASVGVRGADGSAFGFLQSGECVLEEGGSVVSCAIPGASVFPFELVEMQVGVVLDEALLTSDVNAVSISGGGAPGMGVRRHIVVSSAAAPFEMEDYELIAEEEGGVLDERAGSHPFQTTFSLTLNQGRQVFTKDGFEAVEPPALPKDVIDKLPPGLIGNPQAVPQCPLSQLLAPKAPLCSQDTVVGVAVGTINEPAKVGLTTFSVPVYSVEPSRGEPARFAFIPVNHQDAVFIGSAVRTGADYGVNGVVHNITQTIGFLSSTVTLWGVPGLAAHNHERGFSCLKAAEKKEGSCELLEESSPPAFFEMPTSCTGPLRSSVEVDSWAQPGVFHEKQAEPMAAMDGCDRLAFEPSISVAPDVTDASSPAGLTVDVHVPQEQSSNPAGLGESDVRDLTVTLPEGVQINPAGAEGLEACPESLVGFTGFTQAPLQPGVTVAGFTPVLAGSIASGESLAPGVNFCATASKIGTASITTPLLKGPLKGAVYLASQEANPFGSLVAMYIVVEEPESGVLVKIAGQVHLSGSGRILTTIEDSPQAPFEDAKLEFFGGEHASLSTPSHCGAYTTSMAATPWAGGATVNASSTFNITAGPGGGSCPGSSLPFNPSFTGGSTALQAAGFSPISTTVSREDGNQPLQSLSVSAPPGLSGILTGVELCPEPQADEGLCGANSQIGETTVSVGVGGSPYTVKGGKVYLTGPYEGAPFGLSIATPAKAGPYDLENHTPCDCVVVRAKIEINPFTAALTVTSDNEGPYRIPTFLDGIPLQIKRVNVTINRPDFTFNPTSCDPMGITATMDSSEGASQTAQAPFQVADCGVLGFDPKFTFTTPGHTSKADGAGLNVTLAYPPAPFGSQANIAKVKVDLPKQLPSRLSTLNKACLASVFETNPAACPPASIVGHAKVITPLIPVPLEGPAYFVSHGGEAFPSLTMVLQGYGITIELVGSTLIRKGITSTTFRQTPDAPFNTFQLTLPEGPYSALAANGNLCTTPHLQMPTAFVAQNGQEIHTTTPITATGCAKTKKKPTPLAQALKNCRKKHNKHQRTTCEQQAKHKKK